MAAGRGGLLDTVRASVEGILSQPIVVPPTKRGALEAVGWFEEARLWRQLDAASIRQWADRFRPEAFSSRFEAALRRAWDVHQHNCAVAASDPAGMPGLQV